MRLYVIESTVHTTGDSFIQDTVYESRTIAETECARLANKVTHAGHRVLTFELEHVEDYAGPSTPDGEYKVNY